MEEKVLDVKLDQLLDYTKESISKLDEVGSLLHETIKTLSDVAKQLADISHKLDAVQSDNTRHSNDLLEYMKMHFELDMKERMMDMEERLKSRELWFKILMGIFGGSGILAWLIPMFVR